MKNTEYQDHQSRSKFIQKVVQYLPKKKEQDLLVDRNKIPKKIIQFWDNLDQLPNDVADCIKSWDQLELSGFERLLFDSKKAGEFIKEKLGSKYKKAYDKCYHPAMQSDYFRLCYIFIEGGCYVDADDVYNGVDINPLFNDGRLKVQPLCYDVLSHSMISPSVFTIPGAYSDNWIFYFNNNPLIAKSKDLIVEQALISATLLLEAIDVDKTDKLPEIQSTTGPGNLSKAIIDILKKNNKKEKLISVLNNWENIAKSQWPLSYRNDSRNWRLSNCQNFKPLK